MIGKVMAILGSLVIFLLCGLASAGVLMWLVADNENLQWAYADCFSIVMGIFATKTIFEFHEGWNRGIRKGMQENRLDKRRRF